MSQLKRYWFRFATIPRPTPLNLGCGVTARDYDEAFGMLKARVFAGAALPSVVECVEDVDVQTLDTKHVLPNLGVVAERGVWFPLGY